MQMPDMPWKVTWLIGRTLALMYLHLNVLLKCLFALSNILWKSIGSERG
ncbi:hypothetical protein PIL02S_01963 [Paenibacillus illinoisensis]|uniref:Uncharacterized protein n=1 Tax=Paenibacillus illinoisensis TaxID=59845 RepID=A0A2W0C9S2_9BACL|nr:hypothetical protein PIL02S_01963 [Paenibacillus illinoisensis]